MQRAEAIAVVARAEVTASTREQREETLGDWWSGWDHEACAGLPELLRKEMQTRDEPSADAMADKYLPLLEMAHAASLVGVTNAWLSMRVTRILSRQTVVEGDVEPMSACPCCRYRVLRQRGDYDICPVRFWEDDGSDDPMRESGPNGMTLREGRESFERIGAVEERLIPHVLADGRDRYLREG